MNSTERAQLRQALEHDAADLETTTGDLDLYVNYDTGSDVENVGLGTLAKPYKTLKKAASKIAARIAHKVNIYIEPRITPGAAYPASSMPRRCDPIFVGDGSLSIFGVGAPTRKLITGGPHTVASNVKTDLAQIITVAAAAWTVDEFVGYFVRIVTGGHVGRTYPIFGNQAGTITIPLDSTGDCVENADTIEIIAPITKITVEDLDIFYDVHSAHTSAAAGTGAASSLLTLANLWLNASASALAVQFRIHGDGIGEEGPTFDFLRFDSTDFGISTSGCQVNMTLPLDTSYVSECRAAIANMGEANGGAGATFTSTLGRANTHVSHSGSGGGLNNVAIQGGLVVSRLAFMFFGGGAAWLMAIDAQGGEIYAVLDGPGSGYGAADIQGGQWYILIDVRGDCDYAIDAYGGAIVRIHGQCTCDAILCALSALRRGAMTKITSDHSLAGFLGGTAGQQAWICAMDAAKKSATWPAAGTYDTDAKGAEFLRVS